MDKNTKIVLGIILGIGLVFVLKNNLFHTDTDLFKKKQDCSQYHDLVDKKIQESGRVFKNETYTIDEIFYSPKKDTCLYAFTIHTSAGYASDVYNIYDLFGAGVFGGSIDTDYQIERLKLKR
jgi:hypothetical protein